MLARLLSKIFGWKKPDLGYPYEVVRTGRDLFQVTIGGRTTTFPAEVGAKSNGRHEIVIYSALDHTPDKNASTSPEAEELAIKTLEQFLTANAYSPRRT